MRKTFGLVCAGGAFWLVSAGLSLVVAPREAQAGEVQVTSAQLLQDYKDNEVAANEKYKGKLLNVTGKIYRVTAKDVELKGDEKLVVLRVQCKIAAGDNDKVKNYKADQQVRIKGTCEGKKIFGIVLTKCQFE